MTEINLCQEVLENAIGVHRSLEKIEPLSPIDVVAVQAMEELLKYRAIGTIEELQEAKIQYDNINSVANSVSLIGLCDFANARERMVFEMRKNYSKKTKNNKVRYSHDSYAYCPHCKGSIEEGFMNPRVCGKCGGELDWQ